MAARIRSCGQAAGVSKSAASVIAGTVRIEPHHVDMIFERGREVRGVEAEQALTRDLFDRRLSAVGRWAKPAATLAPRWRFFGGGNSTRGCTSAGKLERFDPAIAQAILFA